MPFDGIVHNTRSYCDIGRFERPCRRRLQLASGGSWRRQFAVNRQLPDTLPFLPGHVLGPRAAFFGSASPHRDFEGDDRDEGNAVLSPRVGGLDSEGILPIYSDISFYTHLFI